MELQNLIATMCRVTSEAQQIVCATQPLTQWERNHRTEGRMTLISTVAWIFVKSTTTMQHCSPSNTKKLSFNCHIAILEHPT